MAKADEKQADDKQNAADAAESKIEVLSESATRQVVTDGRRVWKRPKPDPKPAKKDGK